MSRSTGIAGMSVLTVVSLLLIGCPATTAIQAPIDTSNLTVDEIGTPRVAVISVARWTSYANILQPSFQITTQQAFEQAIPTTRSQAIARLDALRAKLQLGLESETVQKTSTETTDASGTAITKETTTERKPGELTKPSDSGTGNSENTNSTPQQLKSPDPSADLEPRLHYRTATSLYQEVQLLDHYVRDAAQREGYTPYVVRLQVTVAPFRRELPLDAYVNLSFFTSNKAQLDKRLVYVVPLLATDSHESAASASAAQSIREFALSVQSLSKTAAGIDIGRLSQALDQAFGRDLNSTFNIGRLNDNTLLVRIGALQQISRPYAMVPRSEYVTALVLVPNECARSDQADSRNLMIMTFSELRDAGTGKLIAPKSDASETEDSTLIRDTYFDSNRVKTKDIDELWSDVVEGDWKKFVTDIDKLGCPGELKYCEDGHYPEPEQVWAELAALQPGYRIDVARFQVPQIHEPEIFPQQIASLDDDGNANTVVRLEFGNHLISEELCAGLWIGKPKRGAPKIVAATSIVVDPTGHSAEFRFPSLVARNIAHDPSTDQLRVAYGESPTKCWNKILDEKTRVDVFRSQAVSYHRNPAPTSTALGYDIAPTSGFVVATKDGTGSLRLIVRPATKEPAKSVVLNIAGAKISNVTPDDKHKGTTYFGTKVNIDLSPATQDASVDIQLANLVANQTIVISSANERDIAAKDIALNIR